MSAQKPRRSATNATANTSTQRNYNPSLTHNDAPSKQNAVTETLQTELHWRQLTRNPATEVVIAENSAEKYFDIGQSTTNRIVITLPNAFFPSAHPWPVQGCIVALVETGCYERELIEVCQRAGAKYIECHSRTIPEPFIVPMNGVVRIAA